MNLMTMPTLGTTESGGEIKMRRTLPNGRATLPAEIVLCYLPHNTITPYATWQRNTTECQGTYWGHYFRADEFDAAYADYEKRGR